MRLLLFTFLGALFCFTSTAQEVSDKQWTHIQKRTADWCPNCGTWGWSFKEELLSKYENDPVLIWSAHMGSSDLSNATSVAMVNNYGGAGQPVFFLDGANLGINSSNWSSKVEETDIFVQATSAFPPFYSVGADATYDGTTITARARAVFNDDSGSSPISLGIYLLQNEMVAFQQGQGNNAVHKNLIMGHLTDEVFGDVIVESNGTAGSEYTVEGSIEMPNVDITNYTIVPVLWSEVNGDFQYQFLNADMAEIEMSNNVNETFLADADLKVSNATNESILATINSEIASDNVTLTLYNTAGQILKNIPSSITLGKNNLEISTPTLVEGMYILRLTIDGKSISEPFMIF